jgi:hypothetical protein
MSLVAFKERMLGGRFRTTARYSAVSDTVAVVLDDDDDEDGDYDEDCLQFDSVIPAAAGNENAIKVSHTLHKRGYNLKG